MFAVLLKVWGGESVRDTRLCFFSIPKFIEAALQVVKMHEGICGWRKVGRRKAEIRKAGRRMSLRRPVRSRLVRMVGSVCSPGM